ncbi:hypothetical protein CPB86DRAFT_781194, partial [Serendipita vermifera]
GKMNKEPRKTFDFSKSTCNAKARSYGRVPGLLILPLSSIYCSAGIHAYIAGLETDPAPL